MKTKISFTIFLAILLSQGTLKAQSTSAGVGFGNTYAAGKFLGWNAVNPGGDLPFKMNDITRMTLQNNTGFLGIGTTTPNQRLTVQSGNINTQTPGNGYMINNNMSLWRGSSGIISNIFVGANAGNGNTTGTNNTFCGSSSGIANFAGSRNTFLGTSSGANNDGANDNTFIGYRSGVSTFGLGSIQNTFVGSQSGQANVTGTQNTFMGFESGFSHVAGAGNVYLG